MATAIDPVCGMTVDTQAAAGKSTFEGQDYYFCSTACKVEFDNNPAKFRREDIRADTPPTADAEADEPRFTKKGGFVSPKFGSAGSGGAEYEPLPPGVKD
jgi:YHS domain-containing protein